MGERETRIVQDVSWISEARAPETRASRLAIAQDVLGWLNSARAMETRASRNTGAGLIREAVAALVEDNLGGYDG